MIFSNANGKLIKLNEEEFMLEKDLQTLVENNMEEVLGVTFVTSEFSVDKYRFDSVAINNPGRDEKPSFVIVEYKKGKNESLVDQGYAYLHTLIDRKSDFVLLYNETFKKSKKVSDFDWEQSRIIFVSPKFTQYQKDATSFADMPFELYEIEKYKNDIISVEKIDVKSSVKSLTSTNNNSDINKVKKEVVVYDEDYHLKRFNDTIKELYNELKDRSMQEMDLSIEPKKMYIAFKHDGKNVFDVEMFKSKIRVAINVKQGSLNDPMKKARDITNIGAHGNGNYDFVYTRVEELVYLIELLKQAYEQNK